MIRKLLSWLGVVALAYVVVFVPLGQRTMWQHFQRIWATDEAQEMSQDFGEAITGLGEEARGRIIGDAGTPDARRGTSSGP